MAERVAATAKTPEKKHTCSNSCKQNVGLNSSGFPADRILQLQRTAGNQAVQRLIKSRTLQAKLIIGQPNDIYEQEADRVAEQVMRMPDPVLQRKCAKCDKDKRKILQAKESPGQMPANQNENTQSLIHEVLHSPGQPLDSATRTFMEPRFGQDLSRVRIHNDAKAMESARAVNALAYTVGRDVVFGEGQYEPEKAAGKQLLAHELTHTIQQSQDQSVAAQARSSLQVNDPGNSHELEAEVRAAQMTKELMISSALVRGRFGIAGLQRQADINKAPRLPCDVLRTGPGHLPGTDVLFGISSSTLTAGQKTDIAAFVSAWVADGSRDDVMVDGWASVDGDQVMNWRLSCDRTEAVKAELVARRVPEAKITTLAHGESTEFSTTDLAKNRRAIIGRQRAVRPTPLPPTPKPPAPTPPTPAETISSQTIVTSPGARTRTTIGVGEEVNLTHSPGSAAWTKTDGTLSSANGVTVILTAPDTAKRITVRAGAATISFDVKAPTSVFMDREPGTGVKHTFNQPDSGILTRVFLGPDTVNFYNVRYRELNVVGVPQIPGVYSCNTFRTGHCAGTAAGAPCPDKALTRDVEAGKGTKSVLGDCAYSGHCGTAPPFVTGSIFLNIPYEYKVGAGAFHWFINVSQLHMLFPFSILSTTKAGATGSTTVAAATVIIPQCP